MKGKYLSEGETLIARFVQRGTLAPAPPHTELCSMDWAGTATRESKERLQIWASYSACVTPQAAFCTLPFHSITPPVLQSFPLSWEPLMHLFSWLLALKLWSRCRRLVREGKRWCHRWKHRHVPSKEDENSCFQRRGGKGLKGQCLPLPAPTWVVRDVWEGVSGCYLISTVQ